MFEFQLLFSDGKRRSAPKSASTTSEPTAQSAPTTSEPTASLFLRFIYERKKVTVKDLQKSVWDYSPDLETHTVETHIYRLRKKIEKKFNDKYFISSLKGGYKLNA